MYAWMYVYDVSMHHTSHVWLKRVISHRYENNGCGKLAHGHHVITLHYTKNKNLNKSAYSAELYYHHFKALN
jgi:hypothetical protein